MRTVSTIQVVESPEPANYPYLVAQGDPRDPLHANTRGCYVSLDAALSAAADIKRSPSAATACGETFVIHYTGGLVVVGSAPVYRKREADELPSDLALWTGRGDLPAFGSEVVIRVNGIGRGDVVGYAVDSGFLGVMVKAHEATRPLWHRNQNPDNAPALVFGAELDWSHLTQKGA